MGFRRKNSQVRRENKKSSNSIALYIFVLFVLFGLIPTIVISLAKGLHIQFEYFTKYRINNHKNNNKYLISKKSALCISIPLLIVFVLVLTEFKRKEKHHLISYRPTTLCKITGICSAIYCVVLPILTTLQSDHDTCTLTMTFTDLFATMSMMSNISRYMKLYLLNKRDVGKMKLYNENYNPVFPGNEESANDFEPNMYLKRLNALVSKQLTFIFFVIPYTILALLGVIIILSRRNDCSSNAIIYYSPIMILSSVTGFLLPYIFINMYHSLNFINKADMLINFGGLILGFLLFVLSLFAIKRNDQYIFTTFVELKSSSLFFLIPSFVSFFCANVIPLIEVYINDHKIKQKKLLSKKEFTKLLMGSRYIDSLKSCAVRCYCVETVIFWDMHMKLMKLVNMTQAKDKENNTKTINTPEKNMESVPCVNISSPVPTNYELLLGLNKNIFGSNNNTILYTGCYSNPNMDPQLVNAMTQGTTEGKFSNKKRSFSLDEVHSRERSNTGPSVTVISNHSCPVVHTNKTSPLDPYDINPPRNDSIYSELTNTTLAHSYASNNFMDPMNSDKTGLLHPTEKVGRSNSHSHRGVEDSPYSPMNSTSRGLGSSYSLNPMNSLRYRRRNPIRNSETEILYDLFNIDPEHTELDQELWKDFDNLYNSFISDKSLATVNLDTDTVNRLKRSINNKDYSVDMFFPAIAETVDLIYQNLYPKLLAR